MTNNAYIRVALVGDRFQLIDVRQITEVLNATGHPTAKAIITLTDGTICYTIESKDHIMSQIRGNYV